MNIKEITRNWKMFDRRGLASDAELRINIIYLWIFQLLTHIKDLEAENERSQAAWFENEGIYDNELKARWQDVLKERDQIQAENKRLREVVDLLGAGKVADLLETRDGLNDLADDLRKDK